MAEKPHAAGIMFRADDGRCLFVLRSALTRDHPNTWCWPGGSIEVGETPKDAAIRECREEVGRLHDAPLGEPIDERGGFLTYRANIPWTFEARLNDEHVAFVWARPSEAPSPLHPGVRATLDMLAPGVRVALDEREPKTLTPIRPSAATRTKYQKRLDAAIEEMTRSVVYWTRAAYRSDEPATVELAQDSALNDAFDKLARRWLSKFDDLAPALAKWFAQDHKSRVDRTLKTQLRKAGFTVKFQMSRPMRDAYNAVIDENVALIKSIPARYLESVKVDLMQSVQNGRDLGYLTDQLVKRTGVAKRRAAFIARDQNNRATAVMARTRQLELGITQAKWLHSAGGKTPRPKHVAFSGQVFDLSSGHDFDDGNGSILPGTVYNCRCVAQPILPRLIK